MASLEKLGFHFSNWIPENPDAENKDDNNPQQTALMIKKTRFGREYREVDPNGNVVT